MKRLSLNFNEKREIKSHETNDISPMDWMKIWKVDDTY